MTKQILFDGRAGMGFTRAGNAFVNGIDTYTINQEIANANSVVIVDDPINPGKQAWKMTLDKELDYSVATNKCRAEITAPNGGSHVVGPPRNNSDIYMSQGVDLWMSWRFMIPSDFVFATDASSSKNDVVVVQIHDAPGTVTRVAPFHLLLVNDEFQLRNSYHETIENDRVLWREKCSADKWYSMVLNMLWDSTEPAVGYMNVWVNKRKVFRESDALNTYATSNSPGPYPKGSGYYYPHGMPINFVRNTIYHGGLQIGTEYSSFDDFASACGSEDTELEPLIARSIAI